tara:strand:+ start:209 stop:334 length:126 start_codon:yes stop_codon:yes gene_type:complete
VVAEEVDGVLAEPLLQIMVEQVEQEVEVEEQEQDLARVDVQ